MLHLKPRSFNHPQHLLEQGGNLALVTPMNEEAIYTHAYILLILAHE